MNKLPDVFIEERAEEFEVIGGVYPKTFFEAYLTFCWGNHTRRMADVFSSAKSIKEINYD